MSKPAARPGYETEQALLDAAERLLVEVGAAGITTRRVAEEAGANHGLVHYYFGSVEQLLVRVLERFTERLIERQRRLYAADAPFLEKWRTAMAYLDEDRPYQKIWFELQALAWNRPELQERLALVHAEWRAVLSEAFAPLEDADPLPRPALPRAHVRRAWQRPLGSPVRARRIPRARIRRRRARGDGRDCHGAGRVGVGFSGRGTVAAARREPPRARRE